MTEDLKEKKQDFLLRARRFPGCVQDKMLFIHHYIKNILEYTDDKQNRFTEIEVEKEDIDIAFLKARTKQKVKVYGSLKGCFFIPDDELDIILQSMIEILREAKALIHLDMNVTY